MRVPTRTSHAPTCAVRHVRPDIMYLDAVRQIDTRARLPLPVFRIVEKVLRDAGLIRSDVQYTINGLLARDASRHGTVLLPMAGEPFKVWPVEHWVRVATRLPRSYWPVSVLSGRSDVERAQAAALAASLEVAGIPGSLLRPKTLHEVSLHLSRHRHASGCYTGYDCAVTLSAGVCQSAECKEVRRCVSTVHTVNSSVRRWGEAAQSSAPDLSPSPFPTMVTSCAA